jgi:hypothetical protein
MGASENKSEGGSTTRPFAPAPRSKCCDMGSPSAFTLTRRRDSRESNVSAASGAEIRGGHRDHTRRLVTGVILVAGDTLYRVSMTLEHLLQLGYCEGLPARSARAPRVIEQLIILERQSSRNSKCTPFTRATKAERGPRARGIPIISIAALVSFQPRTAAASATLVRPTGMIYQGKA